MFWNGAGWGLVGVGAYHVSPAALVVAIGVFLIAHTRR